MKVVQSSFVGGELSPSMYGRMDDQQYSQGLAECRNFIVSPQGPVRNRPGFEFVRAAKYADKPCRLIPFIFSSSQTMVLEFGDYYIRFHTAGATLMSNGSPYEIETPYRAEDIFDIHYCQSADIITLVHPYYAPRELARYSAYDWRLSEIDFSPPLDPPTNLTGTYTCEADSDTVTDAMRELFTIRYAVTAVVDAETSSTFNESEKSDVCKIVGNLYLDASKIDLEWDAVNGADRYRVYKTYSGIYGYIGETEETSFTDSNIEPDESTTPPRYIEPFTRENGVTAVTVTSNGSGYGVYGPVVGLEAGEFHYTYAPKGVSTTEDYTSGLPPYYESYHSINNVWGAQTADFEEIKVTSSTGYGAKITLTLSAQDSTVSQETVSYYVSGYDVVSGGSGYAEGDYIEGESYQTRNGYTYGVSFNYPVEIDPEMPSVYVTDSTGSGAELEAEVSDGKITGIRVLTGGSGYTSPTVVISDSWGGSGAAATATIGDSGDYPAAVGYYQQRRIFAGSANRPLFVWMTRPGTESDMHNSLPSQSDDCIETRIVSSETSRIRHILAFSSLIFLTAGGEFRVATANDDSITPESIGFKPQSYVGAANAQPVLVGNIGVFAAERGGHMREIGYKDSAGGYITGDISLRAEHLFDNHKIVDIALSKAPVPIVWCVNDEGDLLGCTYIPEQNVGGWHRHDTVGGKFESIACVTEEKEDILYAVVKRVVNGSVVRYIERMYERQYVCLEQSFFVDSGLIYNGAETSTLSGLDHLEGCKVAILADGKVLPQQYVEDGKIDLGDNSGSYIVVGLPITAEIKTLPVMYKTGNGGYGHGEMKNITNLWVRVYQSSGIAIGPDESCLKVVPQRTTERHGTPPRVISKEADLLSVPDWNPNGQICIRQKYPLPLMICSVTAEIAV